VKTFLRSTVASTPSDISCLAEKYQLEIVKADGLSSLLRLLQSTYLPLILSSAACVRNVSIHPQNESPIIESGFLQPLINLLAFKDNEEVQCHAISTLRNLAASSEKNKLAIVKAGAVHSIKELVLEVPMNVQSEMTACVAVLALSGQCHSDSFLASPCVDSAWIIFRRAQRSVARDGNL
jgi:vacuolar protein 8